MERNQQRENLTRVAREVYANLDGNRAYALTPTSASDLGVLAAAFVEAGGSFATGDGTDNRKKFATFLQRLGRHIPGLFQQRPSNKKELPQLWTNPITGQPLSPPKSPDERSLLAKYDPELLKWFDEMEKHPYRTVLEHQQREAERQALIAVPYGPKEHETNPYRGDNKTEQAALRKREPRLADFFERESKPVEFGLFGRGRNLTTEGQIHRDAELGGIVKTAQAIAQSWLAQDRAAAAEQRSKIEQEIERLEQQIA